MRSAVEEAQLIAAERVGAARRRCRCRRSRPSSRTSAALREGRKSVLFVSQGPPVGHARAAPTIRGSRRRCRPPTAATSRCTCSTRARSVPRRSAAPRRCAGCRAKPAAAPSSTPTARRSGLKQVMADASAYYLIGYSPSRPRVGRQVPQDQRAREAIGRARHGAARLLGADARRRRIPSRRRRPIPRLTGALRELVAPPDEGRLIDVWVGTEPAE